ncbi:MAG: sulfite exporter TauE/SafE family protein [Anaerolineae bacterium]|nr:sulfite exporter TauE/SafE family protein [Anaerolineae bacterium]
MSESVVLVVATLASLFVASFTQGVTGFGFGMVAMALLPLFSDVRQASIIIGIFSLVTTGSVLLSVRRHFAWRDYLWPTLGMFGGIPLGVYALVLLDGDVIRRLVGVAILIACIQMLLPSGRRARVVSWPWALAAGFTSGILGGAFGIGGPPVIAYASLQNWESPRYKAMLCSFFATSNLYRIIIMLGAGLITREIAVRFLWGLPAVLIGVMAGIAMFGRLSRDSFRRIVVVTLIVLALTLLVL